MIKYLFAMQREADLFDLPNKYVIGIGATKMPEIDKDDIIVNIGFCGGYLYQIGDVVSPTVMLNEDKFSKCNADEFADECICVTCDSFVEKPINDIKAIYDMELIHLSKIKCAKLYSFKIVSDNLSEYDCENFIADESVKTVISILKAKGLIK